MIRFKQVTHQFPSGLTALDSINFEFQQGEFIFLVGPSGAGKTTLLRLLLRELKPTKGQIFFQNENIGELKGKKILHLRRQIGAVFQDFRLLKDQTIEENVALVLEIANKKEEEIKKAVAEALAVVSLTNKAQMFPAQLSGGEFQRAVIARAIVANPDVLFADEPTGNLDPDTAWQIVNLLQQINQAGKTVIMATHNANIVDDLKERVIRLDSGKVLSDQEKGRYKKKKETKKSSSNK